MIKTSDHNPNAGASSIFPPQKIAALAMIFVLVVSIAMTSSVASRDFSIFATQDAQVRPQD